MCSCVSVFLLFVKQKTAYELRISDWSSDVCASAHAGYPGHHRVGAVPLEVGEEVVVGVLEAALLAVEDVAGGQRREHRGHRRLAHLAALARAVASDEIGRASCRERVGKCV